VNDAERHYQDLSRIMGKIERRIVQLSGQAAP
jgi:hypothetical protein